jgi:hypothetical protein
MAFTNLSTTQNVFLHDYLRGTGRSLTESQARSLFNIKNLRARISELRQAGLVVRTEKTRQGANKYSVSRRDIWGSEASLVSRN